MISKKLKLYVEGLFKKYERNSLLSRKKTELLTKIHDRSISLEAEGMTKLDIEKLLIREIESKSLAVDTSDLNIDKSNVLKLKKKTFVNKNLQKTEDFEPVNAEYYLSDFKSATLQNIDVEHSVFKNCYFKNFSCKDSAIIESTFKKSDLSQSNYDTCKLEYMLYTGCHLPKVSFTDTSILHTFFKNCYLKKVSFTNCNLINIRFESCDIANVKITGGKMDKTTYRILQEEGTSLHSVELI
ncbi:pentapeptide repeat-containing protein [Bacillus amyloliquefaciens]|jgi:fluoroquinolone resistance protein|uniref:pentapeptide repeat-containing protein n=1 Tax=Bacillus amyloliquefaciens TaxID=1390 RepID=UPI00157FE253|nr:pentapeptide repeat-containing protein [Bacillus amyloliquefaciens]NUI23623.1 pentapeptide repeat-containing protein [Bacillus amyloliquefaciens]NUI32610.1 pentapeptide repeat-containing protein [Bacillus amyloliquefaciens]NUI36316.1 pentapeptide repeat-containing protein [Bacillus amyloliquefaciens]NUI69984.1 pentapeptide repeat-containing protein [Bacillus amyloliquefaciens]NUI73581.1 pentapeptide repeat-containing protein [Bacillus amyloliquefaciens]